MNPNSGRKYLQVPEYAERISIDRPHIAIAMADEVSLDISSKRKQIATKRTLEWFQQLSTNDTVNWNETSLFGVVPGHLESDKVREFTHNLLQLGAKGITVGGLHQGESELSSKVIRHVRLAIDEWTSSDAKVLIIVQNVRTPIQVYTLPYVFLIFDIL